MAFWWVNQNQTYEHEISGGYMWSPKRNSNGAYNQFYENMTLVQPGDIVFSFRNQKISDVGVIQESGITSGKPKEFGAQGINWSNYGWLVAVKWFSLETPTTPKQHIEELRPTLPKKYAPLNASSGNGLQSVYLAFVPDAMATVLIGNLSRNDRDLINNAESFVSGDQELQDAQEDDIQALIAQNTAIDKTEIEAIIKARKGQGRYRKNLEKIESACRVTGVTDRRLLRASHIKAWRLCENNDERLDGNNGLLLTPSIDLLFDQGYISFSDDGTMLISTKIVHDQLAALNLPLDENFNVGAFNDRQSEYLAYHRQNTYRG